MLRFKGLLALSFVMLMVASASAQEQREGRRGGGRGGFGGGPFGGAFASPAGLVGMPQIQEELNLSEEQKKEISEGLEKMRSGFNFQEFQGLSQEEREKRMEEVRKAGQAFEEKLNKILKPEQQARLKQLSVQRQGTMALTRPELAKDLGLTEDQQKKIREIAASARPTGGQNFQDLSQEERQKLMAENRERQQKAQTEMLAVLTDEQKAKFAELKGKEFTFPQFGFGGGGPGGPGGNRERRRPPTKQE